MLKPTDEQINRQISSYSPSTDGGFYCHFPENREITDKDMYCLAAYISMLARHDKNDANIKPEYKRHSLIACELCKPLTDTGICLISGKNAIGNSIKNLKFRDALYKLSAMTDMPLLQYIFGDQPR